MFVAAVTRQPRCVPSTLESRLCSTIRYLATPVSRQHGAVPCLPGWQTGRAADPPRPGWTGSRSRVHPVRQRHSRRCGPSSRSRFASITAHCAMWRIRATGAFPASRLAATMHWAPNWRERRLLAGHGCKAACKAQETLPAAKPRHYCVTTQNAYQVQAPQGFPCLSPPASRQ